VHNFLVSSSCYPYNDSIINNSKNFMDIVKQKELCEMCDGSGIISIPSGRDDYYQDFCNSCDTGVRLQDEIYDNQRMPTFELRDGYIREV